jgi:hypothetical protein
LLVLAVEIVSSKPDLNWARDYQRPSFVAFSESKLQHLRSLLLPLAWRESFWASQKANKGKTSKLFFTSGSLN